MAAKDFYHDHVRMALEQDGWEITDDPYRLKWRARKKMMIDLGAQKLLLAEREARKIAVEVKSFIGTSEMDDLYHAIGQFVLYRKALRKHDPERELYLAIRHDVFQELFDDAADDSLVREDGVKLIVFDAVSKEILQWIPPIV
jgi:hypothetical protein